MRRLIRRSQGMTLLEVMVALAVLSMAGLAVMKTASENLNSQGILKEKSLALWVAQNHLAEIHLGTVSINSTKSTSEIEMADQTWYLQTRKNNTSFAGLVVVQVDVMTSKNSTMPVASLTGYINQ